MKQIWKYQLHRENNEIDAPPIEKVLHTEQQGGSLCIWVIVDTTAERRKQTFKLVPTGVDLPEGEHVGSCMMYDGTIVLHVFKIA